MISKSVFRYCKVSFYPPNIDTVLFYGQYTNIDTDPQYPKICIEILVLPVFFSINIKTFFFVIEALFCLIVNKRHLLLFAQQYTEQPNLPTYKLD